MAATSTKDGLPQLLEGLTVAAKKNPDEVPTILDSILTQTENLHNESSANTQFVPEAKALLNWKSKDVVSKTAQVISELAKSDAGREKCADSELLGAIVKHLDAKEDDIKLLIQICRALGNICYENDKGRTLLLEAHCLPPLIQVLEKFSSEAGEEERNLRAVASGCLLNLLVGQENVQQKAVKNGLVSLLTKLLETDGVESTGEDTATHVLLILGLLADTVPSDEQLLDERLCCAVVKVLSVSKAPDVIEMSLELLHTQAENEQVKHCLAVAGLCELLITLLEKHKPEADGEEARNLMKMACDLIVLVLTGDDSMNVLYAEGRGDVFRSMINWIESDDEDLQITGVLAMGNFARTDKHCIQMVEAGVSKKLLALLKRNNTPDGDIRLQHALLSALRNLVIPAQNKAAVLSDGLVDAVIPMLEIPTFPVVFKLLGTLRMVVDGQVAAACELGGQPELVRRLVSWCATEDHPGVQGEANRLLAWLIKNSRDQKVLQTMVAAGALPCLIAMVTAEHTVMQNEALLALALVASSVRHISEAAECIESAGIGPAVARLLTGSGSSLAREVILNLMTLLEQLSLSELIKKHLVENGVPSAMMTLCNREDISDIHNQIRRLASMLDSG
ncbi:GTPase-GDP dissociation stimulator vimar [Schistocerca nitens]|uniref:GTPase-GDP dissociation stimulator vimar n=1 Tax=Schistocerca nitens TaxID=7011 RepID=UPI0021196287|nr:GTPase-GDP dissociation stimulator vimar [Schistocerca nitens]